MTTIAICQTNPRLGDVGRNLESIATSFEEAVRLGAQLVVFPECALTGYVFDSLAEALDLAETVPGPTSQALARLAAASESFLVAGMLERVEDRVYNTAILAGPRGVEAIYRKTHILCLGVDRFTTPGDVPFRVHDLPFGRIGILICYDLRFPEPARVLALKGAQAIVLPTNWPESSTIQPDVFTRARAAENRVFVLAADRVGTERGATFLGRSQIVAPSGVVLSEASRTDAHMLVGDVDLKEADSKRVVMRAGEHEMDCFADRRPDLYEIVLRESRLVPTK
jgi:predicted amidohydrolase